MNPLGLPPRVDSDKAMPGPSQVWKALSELDLLASDGLWGRVFGTRSSNCGAAVTEPGHRRDSARSTVLRARATGY